MTKTTSVFLCDGYADKPTSRRGEIEAEIANLRRQLWSAPEDKREILGMIEALEAELRALDDVGGR